MNTRRRDGAAAERQACAHLQAAGLRLVAANVACRGGEIDLVMRDGDCVVFVEVRHRRSHAFGGGAASVDAGKRRRLVLAAQQFLQAEPALREAACRFDVVESSGAGDATTLRWIRDAFRADDI